MVRATTKYGMIKGKQKDGYIVFRGVPYARPPIGELRFRPPQEPRAWEGVLDCTKFGAPALQPFAVSHVPQINLLKNSSEDCLYLNISTPAVKQCEGISGGTDEIPDESAKLPVYIFIHGGAYETGGSNMPLYRGENFVKNGIVYVNINYRMSIFGFMALEELQHESGTTGNYGVLDALQAVKWVHENIASFGGDPNNITVGGESAGAFTTSILMGMKEASGLFQRCILESGSVVGLSHVARYGAGHFQIHLESCREIAADLGVHDSQKGVELLRSLPPEELIRAWFFKKDGTHRGMRSDPILDGLLFEADQAPNPYEQYINDVDLLFGFNTDEGTIFSDKNLTSEGYRAHLEMIYGERAEEVYYKYPVDENRTPFHQLADVIGLSSFKCSMIPYGNRLADMGKNVYGYHFAYLTERLKSEGFGCRHIAELNFVFHKDLKFVSADSEQDAAVASFMNSAWCSFIKSGNPGKSWPRYDSSAQMMLRIDENPRAEELHRKDELKYFERLLLREEGCR